MEGKVSPRKTVEILSNKYLKKCTTEYILVNVEKLSKKTKIDDYSKGVT